MKHATIMETTLIGDANLRLTTRASWTSDPQNTGVVFRRLFRGRSGHRSCLLARSLTVLWERFSVWLITAGLIMAGLAAIAYVIDLAGGRPKSIVQPGLVRSATRSLCCSLRW